METRTQTYRVARHCLALQMDAASPLWRHLWNYTPFETEKSDGTGNIFTLTVMEDDSEGFQEQAVSLGRFDSDGACLELFSTADGGRIFRMFPHQEDATQGSLLHITADYHEARLSLNGTADMHLRLFALNNAMMLLFAFTTATLGTLLMHASVIVNGGNAYMFLGRSGTGKSTHSRLWLGHIPGSRLLNDDNPVIRIAPDGTSIIYGSPWSGKTPCYLNESAPLAAVVRLSQAPCNKITPVKGAFAYAAISPSLSAMRWEPEMADGIHATLSQVIKGTSAYQLRCLPDEAAARLCADTVRKEGLCSE